MIMKKQVLSAVRVLAAGLFLAILGMTGKSAAQTFPLTITTDYTGSQFTSGKSVYDVQVSTDPNFATTPVTVVQVGTSPSSLPAPADSVTLNLAPGTYYVGADWNVTGAGQSFPIPTNNPVVGAP